MVYKHIVPTIKVGDAISFNSFSIPYIILFIRTDGNKYHFDLSNALTMTFDMDTNIWTLSDIRKQYLTINSVDIYQKIDINTIRNEKINDLLR